MNEPERKLDRIRRSGRQLASALIGTAAGVASSDPFVGAVSGWAASELLPVGEEVIERVAGRAAVRVGATSTLIAVEWQQREANGEERREDGFFDERGSLRAEAHELLEGILLTSANCFEEQKLPYLAHIFSDVAYDASVGSSDALFVTRLADQLTYRQLQALAICGRHGTGDVELELELARMDAAHHEGSMMVEPALYQEVNDLAARGLVGLWLGDGSVTSASRVFGGGSESESIGQTALTPAGEFLHRLLRLGEMPAGEQIAWLEQFRGRPRR